MKLVYCTLNLSIKEQVLNKIESIGVKDYQIIDEILAKPVIGSPRLNTAVWPGYNCMILMQFSDDEKSQEILRALKSFNKSTENDADLITAFSVTLDDYFYD